MSMKGCLECILHLVDTPFLLGNFVGMVGG